MPPWSEVWGALSHLLAPSLGAALALMLVVRCLGERLTPLAAALALAGGVLVGNWFRGEPINWQLDPGKPLNAQDLQTVLGWSLEGKPATLDPPQSDLDSLLKDMEGEAKPAAAELPMPAAWYWLPWLAGLAMLVELLAGLPRVSPGLGWSLRTLVAVFAGRLLTPMRLRPEEAWVPWALGLTILLTWAVVVSLGRRWRDGTVAAALALCLDAAAVILLHASSARMADLALLPAAALVAVALVGWVWAGDTSPALAGAAVFLPGLLLNGQQETSTEVPPIAFVLAGLAPLALALLLLPPLARQERWRRWLPALLLPSLVAGVAVGLAAWFSPLNFDMEAEQAVQRVSSSTSR